MNTDKIYAEHIANEYSAKKIKSDCIKKSCWKCFQIWTKIKIRRYINGIQKI